MRPIIVLGMHRSGTSAVTRAIGLLGAEMGDQDQLHKHHENVALRKVNRALLEAGAGTWDAPPDRGWLDNPPVRNLLGRARTVAGRQFGAAEIAVWKDPRTCLTLPFWLDVFEEPPVFLLIHRHPTEVADSLTSRNHLTREHGYALWERYNADAVAFAAGRPTVVIDYDTLVAEPAESLAAVSSAFQDFGVVLPNDPATTEHGLVAQERHHTAEDSDLLDAQVATPSQVALFTTLRELKGAHPKLTLPDALPAPDPSSSALFEDVRRRKRARAAKRSARTADE
jgi:hypothetical protein